MTEDDTVRHRYGAEFDKRLLKRCLVGQRIAKYGNTLSRVGFHIVRCFSAATFKHNRRQGLRLERNQNYGTRKGSVVSSDSLACRPLG